MIDIRHRQSGRVLLSVDAGTLRGANLAGQYLIHADLREMDLAGAVLVFADLCGADLTGASLRGARMRGCNLVEAHLTCADLDGADLEHASAGATVFHDCRSLHAASGLHLLHHRGPSSVDERTLVASGAHLPDNFLRGAGFTRREIARLRQTYRERGSAPRTGRDNAP